MGVQKYRAWGKTLWRIDEWLVLPNGRRQRFRQREIPTKELAQALLAKARAEAFEGRFFDRRNDTQVKVEELWDRFKPAAKRHRRSLPTEVHRGGHITRHLGDMAAMHLTLEDVEGYRGSREAEETVRGNAPSVASINREVSLLRRVLNWAVEAGLLPRNPLAKVALVEEDNIRCTVVDEVMFGELFDKAAATLKPIILTAYDTGMRRGEILGLRWPQVDLKTGTIRLGRQDTKTSEPRVIVLTQRLTAALKALPRDIRSDFVFVNPRTGKRWGDIRKPWKRACKDAGLEGVWFHDLRRSFVTNARRRGIPESVVMRMSGHRTRAVFKRYNVVEEEDLRAAARRLEAGAKDELGEQFGQLTGLFDRGLLFIATRAVGCRSASVVCA